MLKRILLAILLVIQVFGSGAVSLADAHDVGVAPPRIEARHTAGCAVLHDELRCALCHYASTRVVTQYTFTIPEPASHRRFAPAQRIVALASVVRFTSPARAPPLSLS